VNNHKPRIVVVGGGAGGAELVTALGRRFGRGAADITLVDRVASHLWKPRLHEVAAGLISPDEDAVPYLALARSNHFRFQMGALTGLDVAGKTISISGIASEDGGDLVGPRKISYDTLVLAIGSQVNDFGIEGVVEHCHILDSAEQASAFQRRLLERAVQVSEGVTDKLRVGIVGAGATGVELAVELHHAVSAMRRYGGLAGSGRLAITLIDMAPRVLANSDAHISAYADRALGRLGVTLRLNASVARVTSEAFILKTGEQILCDLKLWASGITGQPVAEQLKGLQIGRGRRITCDSFLRLQGFDTIYALGDCAAVLDAKTGELLPATAQVAHQQAAYLFDAVVALHHGQPRAPFKYRPMGTLVSLGARSAVAEFPAPRRGMITFSGTLPKVFYISLQILHRAALLGWARAAALWLADSLRKTTAPPVKLH
jgi:NADH:ubiquinone reductase (H+-translocating)